MATEAGATVEPPPIDTTSTGGAGIGANGADAQADANADADAKAKAKATATATATAVADTAAGGWVAGDGGSGVQAVPRAQAIARIATAPTRVLVEHTFSLDECRNGLSTHAYFEVPASAGGPKPFQAAVVMGEVVPWRNLDSRTRTQPRQLYVAGVQVGTLHTPTVASCHGPMPPRDASVVALVPVRDVAEGHRLLQRM